MAPAKLTVSLRVTGVRADGLHELEAEMVTLELADVLEVDEAGSGLVVESAPGTRGSRPAGVVEQPGHPGPGRVRAHGCMST